MREALVGRIRRGIQDGTYDITSRLPEAIERLLADLAKR